jgi:pyridoxal/pyridoxine/pyridoxamine kinase
VIFEKPVDLKIFPNHSIDVITPNVFELKAMFKAAQDNDHFEGAEWRSLLDSFQLASQFRQGYFLVKALVEG